MITLNTHSLMMPDSAFCLRELARDIREERVDVIALQEVNQTKEAPLLTENELQNSGFSSCGFPIKRDNYALACLLREEDPCIAVA